MFISPQQQQLLEHIERYTTDSAPKKLPKPRKVKPINTKGAISQDYKGEMPTNNNNAHAKSKSPKRSPRKSPRKTSPNSPLFHNKLQKTNLPSMPILDINNGKNDSRIDLGLDLSMLQSPNLSPRSENSSPRSCEMVSPRTLELMVRDENINEHLCQLLEDKNRYSNEQIEYFLLHGADINYQSDNLQGSTPIMIACGSLGRKGVNASCLRVLLSGRDRPHFEILDNRKMSAMHYAAKFNNSGCVLELLNAGAEVNLLGGVHNKTMAIHLAAANDHIDTLRHLIDYGADCNKLDCTGQSPLEIAITAKCSEELIDELVRSSNTTALLQKCMDNCRIQKYRNIIAKLAGKGVEMRVRTAKNKTPLMYAASLGDAQLIRVLCQVPKHLVEGVNARDGNFHTALHSACCWGWVECAQVLIENGADLHATDNNGNTPLHRAAMWNRVDVIKLLLSYGADANIRSSFGVVPLELAYSKGIECSGEPHWESIDVLLPKTNISKFLFPPFSSF